MRMVITAALNSICDDKIHLLNVLPSALSCLNDFAE